MTRRAHPRRHAAGDERSEIVRDVPLDDDDRGPIDHRALAEGADHAERPDRAAVHVAPAIAAVELRTLGDARSLSAQVMQALQAPAAAPAAGNEGEHDMVADRDPRRLDADALDHAGRLVAQHHRSHRDATLPSHHMIVGAAETDGGDADQHFRWSGRIERDAFNRERSAGSPKQGGHRNHGW